MVEASGSIVDPQKEQDRPYKIALLGETGAGKSSLGNLLMGGE